MRIRLCIVLCLVFATAGASGKPGQQAPAGYQGIYVFASTLGGSAAEARMADAAYVSPAIDGVTILEPWARMEPRPGSYDWTGFDAIAVPAIAAGKKLNIGVMASAVAIPAWLFQPPYGVGRITYQRGNRKRGCSSFDAPAFWQPGFTTRFAAAVQAMAIHVKQLSGGWDATRIYTLAALATGISGELRASASDGHCPAGDASQAWQDAGYTPAAALAAWSATAAAAARAFPGRELDQHVLTTARGSAPPTPSGTPPLLTQIIGTAAATYGRKIIIQNDNLNLPPDTPAQPVLDARAAGTEIGWQTTAHNRGGAICGLGPCDPQGFAALLALARQLGGVIMEVHPQDVGPFQPQLAAAHR